MEVESTKKKTGITLQINARTNRLLIEAVGKTQRSKRMEATLRLEDHLLRFPVIAQLSEDIKND